MSSEPAAGEQGFVELATEWSQEDFAEWFRRGAASYADAPDDDLWTVAFPPLLLRYEKDPVEQISAHLRELSEVSQSAYSNACVAVGKLVNHLPPRANPDYVEFLLRLSGLSHPPDVARTFIRFLQSQIVQAKIEAWHEVVTTFVVVVSGYVAIEELSWMTLKLRHLRLWRPIHARFCILEQLKAEPKRWQTVEVEFAADLKRLENEDPPAWRRVKFAVQKARQSAIELEAMTLLAHHVPIDRVNARDEVLKEYARQKEDQKKQDDTYGTPEAAKKATLGKMGMVLPFEVPKR